MQPQYQLFRRRVRQPVIRTIRTLLSAGAVIWSAEQRTHRRDGCPDYAHDAVPRSGGPRRSSSRARHAEVWTRGESALWQPPQQAAGPPSAALRPQVFFTRDRLSPESCPCVRALVESSIPNQRNRLQRRPAFPDAAETVPPKRCRACRPDQVVEGYTSPYGGSARDRGGCASTTAG